MGVLFSGRELVDIAIGIERNGLAFYKSLLESEKDTMTRGAYKYLADMEGQHIKTFQGMLNTAGEYGPPEMYTEEYDLYLRALVDSVVFTNDQVARKMAENARSSAEAIQIALGAEKDSILFYMEMRDLVRSSDRDLVNNIIEEEKSHLRRLTELKRGLGKRG